VSEQLSPVSERRYRVGLQLGALGVLMELHEAAPIPTNGRRRWYVSDHSSLGMAMSFEQEVREEGVHNAPAEVRDEVSSRVDDWHGALPFSEVERTVIYDAYQRGHREPRDVPSQLRQEGYQRISSGVSSRIEGRELMSRWWAWRRELDQFAGQESLIEARATVARMTALLIRPSEMPDIYYDLVGRDRPVPYGDQSLDGDPSAW
jgi:hypothetical protein